MTGNPSRMIVGYLSAAVVLVIATPLILAGVRIVDRQPIRARAWAGGAAILLATLTMGALSGNRVSTHALNDCVRRGEEVRRALSEYRAAHGRYPRSLSELDSVRIPGKRMVRCSLLIYRSEGASYHLEFSDWLTSHVASDQEAFLAVK